MKARLLFCALLGCAAMGVGHARGAALNPNNIIVSWAGYPSSFVQEYTRTGTFVQSWQITSSFSTENARDIGVDASGKIAVFNGTFSPVLTVINPATNGKVNYSTPGWSVVNSVVDGGMAVGNGYAYATDDITGSDGGTDRGIVRFNVATGAADRFLTGTETTAIGLGLNNKLYAVSPPTSPGENHLDILDAATMTVEKSMGLGMSLSGVTADQTGTIFATSGSTIYKMDSDGNVLGSLDTHIALDNIKIAANGDLIMANNGGQIVLSSTALAGFTTFTLNEPNAQLFAAYAAFAAPIPEPASVAVLGIGAWLVVGRGRRR